jgi:glycosyltransferase involved in cell wall biosynthesis
MKWTIGMPCYNNYTENFFTIQALRQYHDLSDSEIVVIDNFGDDDLKNLVCKTINKKNVVYDRYTEITGVSAAKNRIFEIARGDQVLVIDSHILVSVGALDVTITGDDMYQGPLLTTGMSCYLLEWLPEWRSNMWGIWAPSVKVLPTEKKEIWAQGAGFFAVKRQSWLGFNPGFRSFGGETGYIQEKYRRAGRKVWCDPRMVWTHYFGSSGRKIPYPLTMLDRVKNYILGFEELGLSTEPIKQHFGEKVFANAMTLERK